MEAVQRKGEDICRGMRSLELPGCGTLTCSGGVALCVEADVPTSTLIEQADQALYQAKCRGKGICLLWGS